MGCGGRLTGSIGIGSDVWVEQFPVLPQNGGVQDGNADGVDLHPAKNTHVDFSVSRGEGYGQTYV